MKRIAFLGLALAAIFANTSYAVDGVQSATLTNNQTDFYFFNEIDMFAGGVDVASTAIGATITATDNGEGAQRHPFADSELHPHNFPWSPTYWTSGGGGWQVRAALSKWYETLGLQVRRLEARAGPNTAPQPRMCGPRRRTLARDGPH